MKTVNKIGIVIAGIMAMPCISAVGGVEFSIPDTILLLNTANQAVPVYVDNTGDPFQIEGINLELQVADGGPEAGGTIEGPTIQAGDVTESGTLFSSNNDGLIGAGSIVPQIYEIGTLVKSGTPQTYVTVPTGRSLVGEIRFSTAGLSSSSTNWSFSFASSNGVSGMFNTFGNDISKDMSVVLKIGKIALVPEVESYSLWAGGVLVGTGLVRRILRRRG